jgi:hypothetical protein
VRAVDRYLRARAKHPRAELASLWIGKKGRLTESGLAELVRDRGVQAGILGRVHPHLFRHAYAHMMLAGGMQETDLMAVVGWRSRDMVARYADRGGTGAQSGGSAGPRTIGPGTTDAPSAEFVRRRAERTRPGVAPIPSRSAGPLGPACFDDALNSALDLASRSM